MSHIKGKPMHRYLLIAAMLVFGILLAYSPARADEEPPLQEGELEEYVPADPSPDPASAPVCNPDVSGMIAYFPLDDQDAGGAPGTKNTFKNYMGTSDGTCTRPGCPTKLTPGKISGAYSFLYADPYDTDDLPDKIVVPKFPDLEWGNAESFSFETWVKIPPSINCNGNKVFIGRRGMGVFGIWLGCGTGNKARFSVRDDDWFTQTVTGDTLLNNNIWHHVVGVRDAAADKLFLYVDGELEASANTVYEAGFTTGRDLTIGFYEPAPYYYFNGSLDEIALYERAVTLAEVQSHYNGGNGKSYCSAGPVVTDPGDKTNKEGDTVSLQIQASDQDAGTLNYTASVLPEGLTINSTGRISGRLTCEASTGSPYNITVTVKNLATNKSGSTNFTWTVNENANCVTKLENFIPAVLKGSN